MNALLNPSVRQIVAQVDAVLRHDPKAMAIGIRAQGNENWPSRVTVGDREFSLAWCPSPITVREQLVALANEAGALAGQSSSAVPGLVVLTPLSDHALGADVLARLSRGKVFPVEAWDMLRHAFQAKEIDSRLARWSWVAEALLENLPAGGYAPSALPAWWEPASISGPTQASASALATPKEPAKKAKTPSAADALQHPLFDLPVAETAQQSQPKPPDSDWISGLLVSSVFVSQKQWVARAAVKDDEIRALLEALSERGGKISKAALAGRLSMPLMRVSGFVNAARRLLNVDQAPVIMVDETEGSVSLNRALLDTQFFSNKGSQQ